MPPPERITDESRLAELREMNNYHGQPGRCRQCGSSARAPGLCCIVCGAPNDVATPSSALRQRIEKLLNAHSAENGSDTPDFILAEYLVDCLEAFDKAVLAREKWYGRELHGVPPGDVCRARAANSPPN